MTQTLKAIPQNHSPRAVKNQCPHFFYKSRNLQEGETITSLVLNIPAARECVSLYARQVLRMLLVVVPKAVSMDLLSKDCSVLMACRLRFNPSTQASTGNTQGSPKRKGLKGTLSL